MKEMTRYGVVLGLICFVASGLLAGMNSLTKARILTQARAEEEEVLKEVLPQAAHFEPVTSDSDILYYKAFGPDGKYLGVAFKASGKGYSSIIETMVGMTRDGTITAISVLSQNETPGLGVKVTQPPFIGQFVNRDFAQLSGVQAITGATISSRAVIDSVKKKAQELQRLLKDEK